MYKKITNKIPQYSIKSSTIILRCIFNLKSVFEKIKLDIWQNLENTFKNMKIIFIIKKSLLVFFFKYLIDNFLKNIFRLNIFAKNASNKNLFKHIIRVHLIVILESIFNFSNIKFFYILSIRKVKECFLKLLSK